MRSSNSDSESAPPTAVMKRAVRTAERRVADRLVAGFWHVPCGVLLLDQVSGGVGIVGRPGIPHRDTQVEQVAGMERGIGQGPANGIEQCLVPVPGDRPLGMLRHRRAIAGRRPRSEEDEPAGDDGDYQHSGHRPGPGCPIHWHEPLSSWFARPRRRVGQPTGRATIVQWDCRSDQSGDCRGRSDPSRTCRAPIGAGPGHRFVVGSSRPA